MKKILNISIVVFFILFAFGLVKAQDSENSPDAFVSYPAAPQAESPAADEENGLNLELLNVGDPELLPSSPFYFFKEAGRAIQSALAFSSESKAEKKLGQAAERLAEIKKMIRSESLSDKDERKIVKSLEKYQSSVEDVSKRIEAIKGEGDRYNRLMEAAIEKYAAFAKAMAPDEDLALDINRDIASEIYRAKESVLSDLGGLIGELDSPAEKLEEILNGQSGSEFKEIRSLEVLKQLEGKLPARAAEAVMAAQQRIRERMETKLAASVEGKTGENFAGYLIALKGSQFDQLRILDELSKSESLPDEVLNGFKQAKDAAAINFSKAMIKHPAVAEMMEEIASGDIDKLRVLEDLADALPVYPEVREELEKARQRGIDRAVEKMSAIENVDDKINFLIRDGVPDAKSFVVLDSLQAKFSPEQQEQVKAVRNKAFQIFSDIVDNAENRERLIARLSSDSPKDLAVISAIREHLPVEFAPKFDELLKDQLAKVEERIASENNIEQLVRLRSKLDASPEAQEIMARLKPRMMAQINERQMEKVQAEFKKISNPVEIVELANRYNEILSDNPGVLKSLNNASPGLVEKLAAAQAEKIAAGISNLTDPDALTALVDKLDSAGLGDFENKISVQARNTIKNVVVNQRKEAEKLKFMEQLRAESRNMISDAEGEKLFDEEVGALIDSFGGKPSGEAIEKARAKAMEAVNARIQTEIEKRKAAAAQSGTEGTGIPSDIPSGVIRENSGGNPPSAEEINRIQEEARRRAEEKARQNSVAPSGGENYVPPSAPQRGEGSAPSVVPQGSGNYGPSAEEIERIRQEQMNKFMPN